MLITNSDKQEQTTAAQGNSLIKKEISVIKFASQEPDLCLLRTEKDDF